MAQRRSPAALIRSFAAVTDRRTTR